MHRFGKLNPCEDKSAIRAEIERLEDLTAALEIASYTILPFPLEDMLAKACRRAPILDEWRYAVRPVPCLVGLSTGHPRLPGERRSIMTSELFLISEELGWARSYSRWYRLGQKLDDVEGDC